MLSNEEVLILISVCGLIITILEYMDKHNDDY